MKKKKIKNNLGLHPKCNLSHSDLQSTTITKVSERSGTEKCFEKINSRMNEKEIKCFTFLAHDYSALFTFTRGGPDYFSA